MRLAVAAASLQQVQSKALSDDPARLLPRPIPPELPRPAGRPDSVRMPLRSLPLTLALTAILGSAACLEAAPRKLPDYRREVLPILQSHCVRCHGPRKQEARIRLDNLSTDLVGDRAAAETWHEVRNVLNAAEMPPEGEKRLTDPQRDLLLRWVRGAIENARTAAAATEGRVVMRRLTRGEYQNTMSDLLGLPMDYARDLPPDAISREGFRNDGRTLRMSALQLESFLNTARRAFDRILVTGPAPRVFKHRFTESNVRRWLGNPEWSNRLGRQQVFLAKMRKDYPEQGAFRVRVKLKAVLREGAGYPLLEVSVGYRPDTKILFREFELVEVTSAEETTHTFRGRIEDFPLPVRGQGKFPGLVVRIRNRYDDGSPLPKGKKVKKKGFVYPPEETLPWLEIQSVEFEGPVFDKWPPKLHRQILFPSPLRKTDETAYAEQVLKRFMTRAFRRPVRSAELGKMLAFYRAIRPEFPNFEEAMRETLAMVLIRPEFLYLVEPSGGKPRPLSDGELASRLSYFLWSTMPDRALMERALAGQLHSDDQLQREVERMLADPRSQRFVRQFTSQWLDLHVLDRVRISQDYYPDFREELKAQMRGETQHFFAELLRANQSALKLLAADFTMLNEPLARHYGIPNVWGRSFRRVKLPANSHRGGLLGQASILLSNSTGSDSHAVRRGVWIRDRLLNDPPAPPPPDVPTLEEADPKFHELSIREQLEIHRRKPACARCHRDIDPWGIALENWDAVGKWREDVRRKRGRKFETTPVQTRGELPDKTRLDGFESLKKHLLKNRSRQFARSLVTRLLTYALGRQLEWTDNADVDKLTDAFVSDGYRLRSLVGRIVVSRLFRTK